VTRAEERWRDALLAAMIPGHAQLPPLAEIEVGDFWAVFQGSAAPLLRVGLRTAVLVLTLLGPLLLCGRWRLFPSLSPGDKQWMLERASLSRWYLLRQMTVTVKAVACFLYLRDGGVRLRVETS
jgi:hypothetical protein